MSYGIASKINHNIFSKYQNKFTDKIGVVCGTGNTLNKYQKINDAIHIGCNRCVLFDKFIFDFYFFNDWSQINHEYKKIICEYKPNIDKFFGCFIHDRRYGCSQKDADNGNANLYDLECSYSKGGAGYQTDIATYCVGNKGRSTIFSCLQFALYCGFKDIYLVGCDLDNTQFKLLKGWNNGSHNFKQKYIEFKSFASLNFPNTKISVINPINLINIFPTIIQ